MSMTPGGRPSLGAPPSPPARPEQRNGAGQAPPGPSDFHSVLHWGLLMGGLVVVVDLATQLIAQRTNGVCSAPSDVMGTVDQVANELLLVAVGILVFRETGSILRAVIAGLLASSIDAAVVAGVTNVLNCPMDILSGVNASSLLLQMVAFNVAQGPLLAAAGAFASSFMRKRVAK